MRVSWKLREDLAIGLFYLHTTTTQIFQQRNYTKTMNFARREVVGTDVQIRDERGQMMKGRVCLAEIEDGRLLCYIINEERHYYKQWFKETLYKRTRTMDWEEAHRRAKVVDDYRDWCDACLFADSLPTDPTVIDVRVIDLT